MYSKIGSYYVNKTSTSYKIDIKGTLQYFYKNAWYIVCEKNFNHSFIMKVCQKFGYQGGYMYIDELKEYKDINYQIKKYLLCSNFEPFPECIENCYTINPNKNLY